MESCDDCWFATGRALDEMVEVGGGPSGGKVTTQLVTWATLHSEVADRMGEGFDYVDAPYRRMSRASLAQLGISTTPKTPPLAPQVPPTHTPSATQAALGEPWSLVCSLRMLRASGGTTVKGYEALDAGGDKLFDFDPQGGVDFARDHDLDIAFA